MAENRQIYSRFWCENRCSDHPGDHLSRAYRQGAITRKAIFVGKPEKKSRNSGPADDPTPVCKDTCSSLKPLHYFCFTVMAWLKANPRIGVKGEARGNIGRRN
jgi:hypothetical protein